MPPISEQERSRRTAMVQSVLGTHAMEGIEPDAPTLALFRQYESGELTLDELSSAMDAHATRLIAAHQKPVVVA